MNPLIFREYDIRGVADQELTDDVARWIGRSLGTMCAERGKRRIVVGRDCRTSSKRLRDALVAGLNDAGRIVTEIEVGPTPLLYFAVRHLDADGGVMVTGSHNPAEDNGFKMLIGKDALHGEDIQQLAGRVRRQEYNRMAGGHVERTSVSDAYVAFLLGNFRFAHTDHRFVVDAGNGAGGPLAIASMRRLGLHPEALFCDMDGRFPNHHPDPTVPENLDALVRRVRETGAELGIAYDGDADRLGVVDATGEILWGDKLLMLFARSLLERRPGAAVLGEVKCSQVLYDDIRAKGGVPIMWKTGHSLIKAKMKASGALLAGEMSGHMFFADRFFGYDDAIYASLRLLELLAEKRASLRELLADVPTTYATPELRVPCSDRIKAKVVDHAKQLLIETLGMEAISDVDGVRADFGDGWGLVRASNTQPVLVLRFEAQSQKRLTELQTQVTRVVEELRAALERELGG